MSSQSNYELYQLTAREIEIIELIKSGNKYKEIGKLLFISERTVSTHVQNIYSKTKVSNKLSLLRKLEKTHFLPLGVKNTSFNVAK